MTIEIILGVALYLVNGAVVMVGGLALRRYNRNEKLYRSDLVRAVEMAILGPIGLVVLITAAYQSFEAD